VAVLPCPRGCGAFIEFRTDTIGRIYEYCYRCAEFEATLRNAARSAYIRAKHARLARQYAAAIAFSNTASTKRRCPWRLSGGHICGGALHTQQRGGKLVTVCDWCERRLAGVCRVCPRKVDGVKGRSLHCAEHRKAARLAYWQAYYANPEKRRRQQHRNRLAYMRLYQRPDFRARRKALSRAWEQRNVGRRRAAYKRRMWNSPARGVVQNPARRNADGDRLCLTAECENIVRGLAKKCASCRQRDQELATAYVATRRAA